MFIVEHKQWLSFAYINLFIERCLQEEERLAEKRTPLPKPPPIQTEAEKETLRQKMKEKVKKRI